MRENISIYELNETLSAYRRLGDTLADRATAAADSWRLLAAVRSNQELLTLQGTGPLQSLIQNTESHFQSSNQSAIRRSQAFFEKYAMEILGLLGFYSLPYCYAAEEGARILCASKYLTEHPEKRLQETGDFLLSVSRQGAFNAESDGLVWIVKTRMIHARIRLQFREQHLSELPVNQEDLLGTNLSFSLLVIRGLRRMGVNVSDREAQDFLYLWQRIGVMLGLEPHLLPINMRQASMLERIIRKRQFRENEYGKRLAASLLRFYRSQSSAKWIDPEGIISFFLGNQVASMIGLKNSTMLTEGAMDLVRFRNFFTDFSKRNFELLRKQIRLSESQSMT